MAWASIEGIDLYYELHGEGETIVFAHGAGGNHLSWWQQVSFFREKYRCLTFDHRGFGRSGDREGGPGAAAFPEDLRALLDSLGIDRAYLVAQSMGGRTCMGFAAAYPQRVKALVMADTVFGMSDPTVDEQFRAAREARPDATPQNSAYSPRFASEQPDLAFLYDSIRALNPPRAMSLPGRQTPPDSRFVVTTEKLAWFAIPVQFVVGADDVLVPPSVMQAAAKLIPHARYEEVRGCGHSVYFENAQAFNRIVASFLESVGRGVWSVSQLNLTPSARNQWDRLVAAGMRPYAVICSCGKSFVSPANNVGMLEERWLADHYGREGHELKLFEG
ncbi:MAG: alpha/beta hydrolase [Chloroflexota bacterium]|nr:alpha/beta hydrolase [Chloroflexota bacterium]